MTQKIIFLKGLPASGKSTWANIYCFNDPTTVRLNKDDIREELGNPAWSKEFENKVLETQRNRGVYALTNGFSIIIDDTNFAEKHKIYWSEMADKLGIEFEEKFFDVPLDECIRRNKSRKNPVPEAVIVDMYNRNLKHNNNKVDNRLILNQDQSLPKCIIVDLDGTLALMNGRSPFDEKSVINDKPNSPVISLVESMDYLYSMAFMNCDGEKEAGQIIILSGRMEAARQATCDWLDKYEIPFNQLLMRKNGDYRKDSIVKKEIYEKEIKGKFYVDFVLDDRDQVVEMWRNEGLLCLQVYYGNF